ncbi:MAG: 16S rRNA (cytosine(1402)-N(4))-methyltransferase RsmH [Ignavibacteriales bacterium]|nr:16S rRNA (cytosine(1402)-N(4))-methyltransferase RsmH [Ignavibacteriales bacterium]
MTAPYHTPVLLQETLSYLLSTTSGVYVDATLGGGGHAEAILSRLDSAGSLVGLDADKDAIEFSSKRLQAFGKRAVARQENFRNITSVLSELGVSKVAGVLFDLGVSSFQLDEPSRGFSYRSDDRLDMRMDRRQRRSAIEVVNEYEEAALANVFWKYGEERRSRRIAKAIVQNRIRANIQTTDQLEKIVRNVVGGRFALKSLSRVFQALRIEVNNELGNLISALQESINLLEAGGRVVVISYHSLEDRIVKETFNAQAASRIPSGSKFIADTEIRPTLKILTKKPMLAHQQEVEQNPRARSAKLRAAQKV